MRLDYYNISSGLIKQAGKFSSFAIERFLLKKRDGFSSDIYYVEIHPSEIGYISMISGSSPLIIGPKASTGMYYGIFDFLKSPFHQHFMHQTVQSMLSGKDIRETEYYWKLLKTMNAENAAIRVGKLDRLLKRFRETGYKSQYELGNMHKVRILGRHMVPAHELIIGMDRYGRLFRLVGGRHRLALSQHMGLEKISAVLSLIHMDAINMLPVKSRIIINYPEDFRPF